MSVNSPFDTDPVSTLNDDGVMVEPDVRRALKKYLKSMKAEPGKKVKIRVSELRELIREVLAESPRAPRLDAGPPACPKCGSEYVSTWAEDGESSEADHGECADCGYYGDPGEFEAVPHLEAREPQDRVLEEFSDWASDFEQKSTPKQYEVMANQIYDSWPEHGVDVDWGRVLDRFLAGRKANLGVELDRDKLFEKLLDVVEERQGLHDRVKW